MSELLKLFVAMPVTGGYGMKNVVSWTRFNGLGAKINIILNLAYF